MVPLVLPSSQRRRERQQFVAVVLAVLLLPLLPPPLRAAPRRSSVAAAAAAAAAFSNAASGDSRREQRAVLLGRRRSVATAAAAAVASPFVFREPPQLPSFSFSFSSRAPVVAAPTKARSPAAVRSRRSDDDDEAEEVARTANDVEGKGTRGSFLRGSRPDRLRARVDFFGYLRNSDAPTHLSRYRFLFGRSCAARCNDCVTRRGVDRRPFPGTIRTAAGFNSILR